MLAVVYSDDHPTWSDIDTSIPASANSLLKDYPSSKGMRAAIIM
jgi:hypothetical protein